MSDNETGGDEAAFEGIRDRVHNLTKQAKEIDTLRKAARESSAAAASIERQHYANAATLAQHLYRILEREAAWTLTTKLVELTGWTPPQAVQK